MMDIEPRKIKFRVWDEKDKYMFYLSINNKGLRREGFVGVLYLSDDKNAEDDFILMQYTGLLDTTGREIYEGDIWEWYCDYEKETYRFVVVFDNAEFTISAIEKGDNNPKGTVICAAQTDLYGGYGGKIIGNVFDAKELTFERENYIERCNHEKRDD